MTFCLEKINTIVIVSYLECNILGLRWYHSKGTKNGEDEKMENSVRCYHYYGDGLDGAYRVIICNNATEVDALMAWIHTKAPYGSWLGEVKKY